MYPAISDYGLQDQREDQRQRSPYRHPQPPSWPPSQLLSASQSSQNGPAPPPTNASNFPMLRVHIADHLRTSPPVMITAALEDIPRAQFSYTFEYEHQIVQRLQSGNPMSSSTAPRSDPFEEALTRLSGSSYSRQEVAIALAALGNSNPDEQEVQQFCKNYRELKSMGFDVGTVVGALVVHRSDLAAATDACLSAQ